jgi:hypothetical protein
MSDQDQVFTPRAHYRVLKKFVSLGAKAEPGDLLVYVEETYSRYDSAKVFIFRRVDGGDEVCWLLYHGQPLDMWREYFAEA